MNKTIPVVLLLAALATSAPAAEEASIERGKELFNSTELGTNHKGCASCHNDGEKLKAVASYDDQHMARIINLCIRSMLKGKPLPVESDDMAALISYLRSIAPPLPATREE